MVKSLRKCYEVSFVIQMEIPLKGQKKKGCFEFPLIKETIWSDLWSIEKMITFFSSHSMQD